jgi:hypothetical protein
LKKIPILLFLVSLVCLLNFLPNRVHAQTDAYTANVTTDGSNDVLVNGESTNADYVANGDNVNLTIDNNADYSIVVCTKGSSPQQIAMGGNASTTVTVNGEAEIDIVLSSGSNCGSGSGNPGYLYIEGATGSLGCSTSNGDVWNVTGQYSYVPQSMYLYRGSTYVADVPASTGGGGYYFTSSVDVQFAAETAAATYYLYDGTSNSDELIGQATCPAITGTVRVASPPVAGQPNLYTTPTPAVSPTTSTTPTTTPAASSTQKSTKPMTVPTTKSVSKNLPKKVSSAKAALYVSGGGIIALVVVLLVLNFMNVWTLPKKLLLRVWHLKKAAK